MKAIKKPLEIVGGGYKITFMERRVLSSKGSALYRKRGEGLIAFTMMSYV